MLVEFMLCLRRMKLQLNTIGEKITCYDLVSLFGKQRLEQIPKSGAEVGYM